ncbi:hypothetical protein GCM10009854_07140 [Saccharopolyspora halophila]|uniref:Small secreted hydrophilic protein n=1 Tax=Saccharopolyspora halophila TaxID=405551 RepID=A0ABN3FNG9_9PSEU
MRSVPKGVLVLAALALPVAAVLISFALTDSPRAPQVPERVQIGSTPGPDPTSPTVEPPPGPGSAPAPPADLPPPAPNDDDGDDDLDDHDD